MGVHIKGMEMPKGDNNITLFLYPDGKVVECGMLGPLGYYESVPVQEPHGRLIDADAMIASIKSQTGFLKIMGGDLATTAEILEKGILQEIENAPTVIPTSKEGE